eukprot:CAMPEP_0172545174 /NCGR_PEP_ID=MMETSP1067-20121228/15162_1 /TAXON_ID=265564 ORGANISM="Thalassiosira punctigera, Strain Tpunct2005C2" /NCGR_SAMPLE_ID=MMETSP1067 /ASSEMBLY_ACC=CAM_ASM_000444 /LENGTH=225 /DNA_ID=CAMNT_0013331873 /DNA_START=10 /DNA_END=687 /DNA_ORIENTATION=-
MASPGVPVPVPAPPPTTTTASSSEKKSSSDYIRTGAQNYISRRADVRGAPNLSARGKSVIERDASVRGDFGAPVRVGRYCRVDAGATLAPSVVPASSDPTLASSSGGGDDGDDEEASPPGENERALPLVIGSHTVIGPRATIRSVSVGSCVRVGADCVLSSRSRVHDCCVIEDGTVVPPDMVVPPFSRVRGSPGRIVGTLPECAGGEFVEDRVQDYLRFVRSLED